MKKISFTLLALVAILPLAAQHRSTFDDLSLSPDTFWNGSSMTGGFQDSNVYFSNNYNATYSSWSGFAYSDKKDTATAGYTNQYSSAAGGGVYGSSNFAVCYTGFNDAKAKMTGAARGQVVYGMYVTNSTYDYLSMKNGDRYAKKFGGATGTDPDWFRLTVSGWYNGAQISNTVQFYLADFRSPDTTQHYILKSWNFMNLSSLGNVDSLSFLLESTDTAGGFGMNTPAYFCLDNMITSDGVAISPLNAINDSVSLRFHDSIIVPVLANDTFGTYLRHTVSIVSGPQVYGSSAYVDSNNNVVYTPAIGIRTIDTIYYSLCYEVGICDTAYIALYINGDTNTAITDVDMAMLRLYPNPVHDRLTIASPVSISHISLIDMSGREVMAMDMDMDRQAAYIDIAPLGTGLYTALIHTSEGIISRRFTKE
jgi:hypothetical protein